MKHNISSYSDNELICLCKSYNYIRDIPNWLYLAVHRRGIADKAQAHMINLNPQRNLKEVWDVAKNHETRTAFHKNANWAYTWAYKHGFLDKVCQHMNSSKDQKKRCIYIATFDDGCAYVGLTWFTKDRWTRHMTPSKSNDTSPIYIHYRETGLKPHFEQITEYLKAEEAQKAEKKYIKEFKKKWCLLNTSNGGELGSSYRKWTKKHVYELIYVCSNYTELHENFPGAYNAALKNGWLEELSSLLQRERQRWTENKIRNVFAACSSIKEIRKKYPGACNAARDLGIYSELTDVLYRQSHKPYTQYEIFETVKELQYREDFVVNYRSMYNAAIRLGILSQIYEILPAKPHGKSLNDYIELSKNYASPGDLKKAHPGAYAVIAEKRWAKHCFAHMTYKCRVNLSDEDIIQGAKKYKHINEWQESEGGAYNAAKKRGLFKIATSHMTRPAPHNKKPDDFYISLSHLYQSLKLFKKEHHNEFVAIRRRGQEFEKKCFNHMIDVTKTD